MRRRSRFPWLFLLLVIMPSIVGGLYYYKYASDQFVSEAHFIIQGSGGQSVDVLGALTGVPSAGSGGADAMIIQDYLQSLDFLSTVDKALDIRRHFSDQSIDGHARLPYDVGNDDFRDYWQDMIEVEYDIGSGITALRMTSFDAVTSQKLVKLALQESEKLINRLSNRLRGDTLELAKQEAEESQQILADIRAELTRFREQQSALDPVQEATAEMSAEISARLGKLTQLEGIASQLSGDLARAEAELTDISSYMRNDSVRVKAAQRKVIALRQQVAKAQQNADQQRQVLQQKTQAQQKKSSRGRRAAAEVAEYAELQAEEAFAQQMYQQKVTALEAAQRDYARQQRYLTITVQPSLPDEAIKPDKLIGVITVILLSFLSWGIVSLSLAAIRDHIGWV